MVKAELGHRDSIWYISTHSVPINFVSCCDSQVADWRTEQAQAVVNDGNDFANFQLKSCRDPHISTI